MSQLGSTERGPGIPVQKPRPDIYTVLLGLSLAAIIIAIIMLVLELGRYNWDYKAASVRLSMTAPAMTAPAMTAPAVQAPGLFLDRAEQMRA